MAEMITLTRPRTAEEQKFGKGDISIQVDQNFDRNQAMKDGFTNLPPVATSPAISMNSNSPVSSSEGIRSAVNAIKATAADASRKLDTLGNMQTDALNSILGSETYAQSTQGQKDLADLESARAMINSLSMTDEQRIKEAGMLEGRKYDSMIAEAEAQKTQGLPKSVINAGERGGFLSSQFSGRAALQPTNGGTFIGAGGELENIASAYDRNIQSAKAAKENAIAQAEAAERKAIMTGKREDYQMFLDAYDRAEKAHNAAIDLGVEKINAISKYETSIQARTAFLQDQEDRSAEALAGSLLFQYGKNISPETLSIVAQQNGIDPNVFLAGYKKEAQSQAQVEANLANQYYSIARNIKEGETYKDPATGVTVIGAKEVEPDTIEVTRTIGNTEYLMRYDLSDPTNPKEQFRIELGPRWKEGNGGGSSDGKATTLDQAFIEGAQYLDGLKKGGALDDLTYNWVVDSIMGEYGIADTNRDQVKSNLNTRLGALDAARGVKPAPAYTTSPASTTEGQSTAPSSSAKQAGQQARTFISQNQLIQDYLPNILSSVPNAVVSATGKSMLAKRGGTALGATGLPRQGVRAGLDFASGLAGR